jgi:electron transport complex protein RnfC
LRADRLDLATTHGLAACIECGHCDSACPSRIALLSSFVAAKVGVASQALQSQRADDARQRYQQRQLRLERESEERAAREMQMAQQATSIDAVAAAIERANARRQQARREP